MKADKNVMRIHPDETKFGGIKSLPGIFFRVLLLSLLITGR